VGELFWTRLKDLRD